MQRKLIQRSELGFYYAWRLAGPVARKLNATTWECLPYWAKFVLDRKRAEQGICWPYSPVRKRK